MSTSPRTSSPSGTINWSTGEPFDGYCLIGVVLPTSGGTPWPQISQDNTLPGTRLPVWIPLPIREGTFLPGIKVFYNADIEPPNTKYVAYYYDLALKLIASPTGIGDMFTVTTDPFTLPAATLTAPIAGTSIPVPEAVPTSSTSTGSLVLPLVETPAGAINGTNATFTITRAPSAAMLLFKNRGMLTENVGYTLSGTTITFLSGYIPQPSVGGELADDIKAVIF